MTQPPKDCAKNTWPMVRLGDVCEFIYGYPFDSKLFNADGRGDALVRIRDVIPGRTETYTTQKAPDKYNVFDGDLLVGMDGDFNLHRWCGGNAVLNQRVCMFRPIKDKLMVGYITHCLGKSLKGIWEKKPFSTVKHLSAKDLNAILIPLPPLAVQREIVARLEKELGEAEKVAAKFKRLAELADETFKAELDETFKTIEGENVRLGDVCKRLSSGKFIAASDIKRDGEIPVFGANGLRGYACLSNFDGECVIIGRQGALCGNVRYYNGCAYMTDHAIVATFKTNVDAVFMMHQLGNMNLGQLSKQAAQPGLAVSVLAMQYITLPPLSIQRAIVAKLDAAKERCEKLKSAALRGLAAAENLRKAILAEAFQ